MLYFGRSREQAEQHLQPAHAASVRSPATLDVLDLVLPARAKALSISKQFRSKGCQHNVDLPQSKYSPPLLTQVDLIPHATFRMRAVCSPCFLSSASRRRARGES